MNAEPLTAEELDTLRAEYGASIGWPFNDVRRLLATLDAARAEVRRLAEVHAITLHAMDEAESAARSASPVDREDELGAAWEAAEAALPEGWDFGITMTGADGEGRYHASAAPFAYRDGKYANAATPAAALRALAGALAARSKDPSDAR